MASFRAGVACRAGGMLHLCSTLPPCFCVQPAACLHGSNMQVCLHGPQCSPACQVHLNTAKWLTREGAGGDEAPAGESGAVVWMKRQRVPYGQVPDWAKVLQRRRARTVEQVSGRGSEGSICTRRKEPAPAPSVKLAAMACSSSSSHLASAYLHRSVLYLGCRMTGRSSSRPCANCEGGGRGETGRVGAARAAA